MTTTKRSLLVQQLSFPSKGKEFLYWVAAIICLLVICFIEVGIALSDSSASATEKDNNVTALGVFILAFIVALFVEAIAADIHYRGRAKAKKLWDTLYYCFRDDVIYAAHDPKQCAPPDAMRTAILKY